MSAMVEVVITSQQRRAALQHALRGGGKARVELTSGQRRALGKPIPRPETQTHPVQQPERS